MKHIFYLLLCFTTLSVSAQQVDTVRTAKDTTRKNIIDTLKKDLLTAPDTVQHLRSKALSLVPPAALVGYGVASFYIRPMRRFDRYVYREANEHDLAPRFHAEDYFQYAPVVLTYGLNLVGVHGKNTFVDRTLIYVMAQGMMNLALFSLKHATHRLRPNGADRLSFPSGHTSNAFANAEFMAQELSGNSPLYGVAGYTLATTTGILRIYHQNHWFSDVVGGAGFGILATKGAYLLYPYIRNSLFGGNKKDEKNRNLPPELQKKKSSSTLLLPTFQEGAFALQFSMQF